MYQAICSKLSHNIFAIAVAQLPPPITANFGCSILLLVLNCKNNLFRHLTIYYFVKPSVSLNFYTKIKTAYFYFLVFFGQLYPPSAPNLLFVVPPLKRIYL